MARQIPPSSHTPGDPQESQDPQGDPWLAFGHLVGGVLLYGLIGWALDRWLHTSFLVVLGIVLGAGLGLYATWKRFAMPPGSTSHDDRFAP